MFHISNMTSYNASNILGAIHSDVAPNNCTSTAFAYICKTLCRYYSDLFYTRACEAYDDPRVGKDISDFLFDKQWEWSARYSNWERCYLSLVIDGSHKTALKRSAYRKNVRLKEALLAKHWDAEQGLWNFGTIHFG